MTGGAIARLRQYLDELPPHARALLATEVERALVRGDETIGAAFLLQALRRKPGPAVPRSDYRQRMFFGPLSPFLIDQTGGRYLGRVSRASLDPIWDWICRDLAPAEAQTYVDDLEGQLAEGDKARTEQIVRTFQDVVVERLREMLGTSRVDEKAVRRIAGQIGLRDGIEDLRSAYTILRARDALAVVASRLPAVIGNLADAHLDNVKALLASPVGSHPDVFLHALILAMDRLAARWQLIRLAVDAAGSDVASRVAQTPYGVAIDLLLADIRRAIAAMRDALAADRRADVAPLIKDIHDAARALHTELDLSGDGPWARELAAARAEAAALLQDEIETLSSRVRGMLRVRSGEDASPLDAAEVADVESALDLFVACRDHAAELALSEATRRVDSDLQNFFDTGTQLLIDGLRSASPAEREARESQADAAVRLCSKLFGIEYASLLSRAAGVAGKGEMRAAHA